MKNRLHLALLVVVVIITSMVSSCKPEPVPLTKPSVSVQVATSIATTSATLMATVTPNSGGTVVTFEYKSVSAVNWQTATLSTTYSGKTSVGVSLGVTDLTPATEYAYRVKAVNASGQAMSVTSNFTTLAPVVMKPAVAIKSATGVEITKATLVAKVVPNENGTTISFEYKTLAASTWTTVPVSGTFAGKDSVAVSLSLSTLVANTDYVYRVKASNVAGETISSESNFQTYAVKDYDGNYYHTVTIGTQIWLKENLKTAHFANGDPIPNVTDATAWTKLTTGAYCWYNNDSEIGKTYGALYNWFITNDPRGLLVGYHVATDAEWFTMANALGSTSRGGKLKESGTTHWQSPNTGATNESKFTALPGGGRIAETGEFTSLGINAYFPSCTSFSDAFWVRILYHNRDDFHDTAATDQNSGTSIRLIKN